MCIYWLYLLIIFIDKIYHHLHHNVLFFSPAFCNHQSESYKSVVGNTFMSIFCIKNLIVVEKPKE